MSVYRCFLAGLLMTTWIAPAFTQETRIVSSLVAPYAYVENGVTRGVVYDVVAEMAKRIGHSGKIQFYPLARAQSIVRESKNTIVFPLTRIESREKYYAWLVPVFQDKMVLLVRSNSNVDISTVHAARKLKIGVALGSPAELQLGEYGFTSVDISSDEEACIKKLILGRIDVWMAGEAVARYTIKKSEAPGTTFKVGLVLCRPMVYLAGSRDIDQKTIDTWRSAFDEIKSDGLYEKILEKY